VASGTRSATAPRSQLQAKFYPGQNIAFFVRDSVNLRSFVDESPLRNWRNQLFVGIDWDF